MRSDKQRVLDWFYRESPRCGLLDFSDLLSEAASTAVGLTGDDRDRFVQSRSTGLWNSLRSLQESRRREGVTPVFELLEDVQKCRWFSSQRGSSVGESRRRIRLRSRPNMIETIDHLDWREYEALGCAIAELCGAGDVQLTSPGNECGIDFFAVIHVCGNNHIFSGSDTSLRVVGQSKKYENPVEVEKVKSFYDVLTDIHKKEPKVTSLVPAWFQEAGGPVVGWMVAHSGFQSGARTRARNHGILVSDTVDLAEIAALSRSITETASPDARCQALVTRTRSRLS